MGKIIWIDTETTGLNPGKNAMIQLSGIIDIDGEIIELFNFFLRPHKGAVIDQGALDVNGRTVTEMQGFPQASMTILNFKQVLSKYVDKFDKADKFVVAGYKTDFDTGFLRATFSRLGDKYYGSWFFNAQIDVLSCVGEEIVNGNLRLENYKLATVCGHYGIPIENAHNSMVDIEATRNLYYLLRDKKR